MKITYYIKVQDGDNICEKKYDAEIDCCPIDSISPEGKERFFLDLKRIIKTFQDSE
jgi:hypothetical protein